jgi:hypothetical protein
LALDDGNLLTGALEYKDKHVIDVMTTLDKVFMAGPGRNRSKCPSTLCITLVLELTGPDWSWTGPDRS